MPKLILSLLIVAFSFVPAQAAVIVEAGFALNDPNWVDSGYGTKAYFFFASSTTDINSDPNILTSLVTGGDDIEAFNTPTLGTNAVLYNIKRSNESGAGPFSYATIQSPDGEGNIPTGTIARSGINDDTPVNLVNFTFKSDIGSSYRVGILVANNLHNSGTVPGSLMLTIGSANVTASFTRPSDETATANWYFFDITDIAPSDTLRIFANRYSSVSPAKMATISGVTFSAIPEPSTIIFSFMALIGIVARGYLKTKQ